MSSSQPLVCIFFKLAPSHQSVPRIHEIGWNVFPPQLNCLNDAFEAAQAPHPSLEAKKNWSEARHSAAKKMNKLQDVAYQNYKTASHFLAFAKALQLGRSHSDAYDEFRSSTRQAILKSRIAQEVLLKFREDIRIVVGQITTLLSVDGNDISPFIIESNQSLLELATAVEECHALLEEHRVELMEVQRQSLDENDNHPSEADFQMVQEKWLAFKESSGPTAYRWQTLVRKMQEPEDSDEPVITSNNFAMSTMPTDTPKCHGVPFWRTFLRHLSRLSVNKLVR